MTLKHFLYQLTIFTCIFFMCNLFSCSESSTGGSDSGGELFIKLHDAPADFQQVNISINLVSVHKAGDNTNLGWVIASENSVDFDLLTLRNGRSELLVLNKIDAGNYDLIKLHFGPCTVVDNGTEYLLDLASAPVFDQILDFNFEIEGGRQTQLSLDFDVSRSISKSGFNYRLSPVIRVQNTLLCGWISGSIIDTINSRNSIPSTIYTWTGLDSVSTQNELSTGSFQLPDLPENYYSIRIVPADSIMYQSKMIDSLQVIRQRATNIGVVVLPRK